MTRKEYNECVKLYSDGIYRFALKHCNGRFSAEDVIQDVFEKLWKKKADIKMDKVKSLLFTMTNNRIIDLHRYHKIRMKDQKSTAYQISEEENIQLKQMLELALNQLTKEYRSLILLRDYEGFSYDEISKILDMSLSKVKVYLFRARREMQKHIQLLETV